MTKLSKQVGSVQRALEILDLFDLRRPELGTTEIARAMSLPKSTIAGLIYTLEQYGYLSQNSANRKYHLGFKLAERAGVLLNQFDLREVAAPYLRELCNRVDEDVNLAVRDGNYVVYIERLLGSSMLGMRSEIGKREKIHSTALGKAILAHLSTEEVSDLLTSMQFVPVTPYTITTPAALKAELQRVRQNGFALDNQENEMGGRCVAAPIFDYRQAVVGAVSLSMPLTRFPDEKINVYGNIVRSTARHISRSLGAADLDSHSKEK